MRPSLVFWPFKLAGCGAVGLWRFTRQPRVRVVTLVTWLMTFLLTALGVDARYPQPYWDVHACWLAGLVVNGNPLPPGALPFPTLQPPVMPQRQDDEPPILAKEITASVHLASLSLDDGPSPVVKARPAGNSKLEERLAGLVDRLEQLTVKAEAAERQQLKLQQELEEQAHKAAAKTCVAPTGKFRGVCGIAGTEKALDFNGLTITPVDGKVQWKLDELVGAEAELRDLFTTLKGERLAYPNLVLGSGRCMLLMQGVRLGEGELKDGKLLAASGECLTCTLLLGNVTEVQALAKK